jgi:ribosomal protein L11
VKTAADTKRSQPELTEVIARVYDDQKYTFKTAVTPAASLELRQASAHWPFFKRILDSDLLEKHRMARD